MIELKEGQHQMQVVKWWRTTYPHLHKSLQASASGAVLGGNPRARAMQMNTMKASGLVIGQADLFLAIPKQSYHGLYIEMKAMKGRPSDDQLDFIDDMRKQGYKAEVCYGHEAAIEEIKNYIDQTA
jgi:hypothetical protein